MAGSRSFPKAPGDPPIDLPVSYRVLVLLLPGEGARAAARELRQPLLVPADLVGKPLGRPKPNRRSGLSTFRGRAGNAATFGGGLANGCFGSGLSHECRANLRECMTSLGFGTAVPAEILANTKNSFHQNPDTPRETNLVFVKRIRAV